MSNLTLRECIIANNTIPGACFGYNPQAVKSSIDDAEDRIVTVLSRYILDNELPDLILDEGAYCRERATAAIDKIDLIVKDDRIPLMEDLEEIRLIVANIRAVQEHLGSNSAYEEAQKLVRDLNRYRNQRYDAE